MPELLFDRHSNPEVSYNDAFLVPRNGVLGCLAGNLNEAEQQRLDNLWNTAEASRQASLDGFTQKGWWDKAAQEKALADLKKFRAFVIDMGNKYPEVVASISRDHVDFTPRDGIGKTPIVVSNMDKVTGKRMAEAAAMVGASAAIPQYKSDEELREIAEYLRSRNVPYLTPVTVTEKTKIGEARSFIEKRDMDTAVVLDDEEKFLGVLSESDIPKGSNDDSSVGEYVNTKEIVTAEQGISNEDALRLMQKERIDLLPVLSDEGKVVGVYTQKGAAMQVRYHPNEDTRYSGLEMMATVGALNKSPLDRVRLLVDLNVSAIVFDTAHFDQGLQTYKNIQAAADIVRSRAERHIPIIAGNVVTREATRNIFASGGDVAKVGIGPGAACTTRMETGTGRPQLSAVLECAEEADIYGKHVWADGGVKHPRDVVLALAAGASQVMIGTLFTALHETPPSFEHDAHGAFKANYGMASARAGGVRSRHRQEQEILAIFRSIVGLRTEGANAVPVYQHPERRSVADYVHYIMDGVTSAVTYAGERDLKGFAKNAVMNIQTSTGFAEGKPAERL